MSSFLMKRTFTFIYISLTLRGARDLTAVIDHLARARVVEPILDSIPHATVSILLPVVAALA